MSIKTKLAIGILGSISFIMSTRLCMLTTNEEIIEFADFIHAAGLAGMPAATLEQPKMKVITDWLNDPFWP